jgi:hypothetical protein
MIDPLTGEEFQPKKNSQRFANAQNRIKYNNMMANEFRREKSVLDKPLSNNLKILNELMSGKNEGVFHDQYLLGKGYDFKAFNCVKEHNGTRGYGIYHYVMLPHENEHRKFVRYE